LLALLYSIIVIGPDFHRAMVATATGPGETPHRVPPCEELDPAAISPQTPLGEFIAPSGALAI